MMWMMLTMKMMLINYCNDNVDTNDGGVSVNIVNNSAAASDNVYVDRDDNDEDGNAVTNAVAKVQMIMTNMMTMPMLC